MCVYDGYADYVATMSGLSNIKSVGFYGRYEAGYRSPAALVRYGQATATTITAACTGTPIGAALIKGELQWA